MEKTMDKTQSNDLQQNKSRNFTEKVARIPKHDKFEHFSQGCEKLLTGMYLSVQKNTCSLKNCATAVYKEKNET